MFAQNLSRVLRVAVSLLAVLPFIACDGQAPSFKENVDTLSVNRNGTEDHAVDHEWNEDLTDGSNHTFLDTLEKSFSSAKIENGKLRFRWNGDLVDQLITLQSERTNEALSYRQTERPQRTELFAQGSEEINGSETFLQNSKPTGLLDILIVVDNSGSMEEEQNNLSGKLAPLLEYVAESDWRVGVVTTDPGNGCLRALISKGDQNYETAFAQAIMAGIGGTGNEQGIRQAVAGLKGECNNGTWLRPNSALAVLIVSDEDNCSANGGDCGTADYGKGEYLTNYMNTIREVGVNARVYGLVWHASQTHSQCSTAANQALVYSDVIEKTGGSWGSICDSDYSDTLLAVSQDLSIILKNQFALRFKPFADTLNVFVDGALVTTGYTLTGNVVEFQNPPAAGATVKFTYRYYAEAPSDTFVLQKNADADEIRVLIDGKPAGAEAYTYLDASKTIRFTKAPVCREVKVIYRVRDGLQSDFPFADRAASGSVDVKVNGQVVPKDSYTVLTDPKVLRFTAAPVDGAEIRVTYAKLGAPKLDYPAFMPDEAVDTVTVFAQDSNTPVTFAIDEKWIRFPESEFSEDRNIVVRYKNPSRDTRNLDVGHAVLAGSVAILGDPGGCRPGLSPGDDSVITLEGCNFSEQDYVGVSFTYASSVTNSFTIDDKRLENATRSIWTVKVNGKPTTAFTREGNTITFESLEFGATITVVIRFVEA